MSKSTSNPFVSVVMPTYNRARLICEAIDSVLAQTYDNFEIIVVDDGSIDDTKMVLNSRYGNRIRYIYQSNNGPSGARNRGIEEARHELIHRNSRGTGTSIRSSYCYLEEIRPLCGKVNPFRTIAIQASAALLANGD